MHQGSLRIHRIDAVIKHPEEHRSHRRRCGASPPSNPRSLNSEPRVLGVVGLTTAVKIQEKGGYKVTIIAENLPTDPKTPKYTSLWAVGPLSPPAHFVRRVTVTVRTSVQGAHHVSHAGPNEWEMGACFRVRCGVPEARTLAHRPRPQPSIARRSPCFGTSPRPAAPQSTA